MTKQQETLRLAFEALHYCEALNSSVEKQKMQAITAIKEALETKDELVCDKNPQGCWSVRSQLGNKCKNTTSQRTWVGLTDEEIFEIHKQVDSMQYLTFGKAIEAKLKEKNT